MTEGFAAGVSPGTRRLVAAQLASALWFCAEAETWPVFTAWVRNDLGWWADFVAARLDERGADALRGMAQALNLDGSARPDWRPVIRIAAVFVAEPETWPVFQAWRKQYPGGKYPPDPSDPVRWPEDAWVTLRDAEDAGRLVRLCGPDVMKGALDLFLYGGSG